MDMMNKVRPGKTTDIRERLFIFLSLHSLFIVFSAYGQGKIADSIQQKIREHPANNPAKADLFIRLSEITSGIDPDASKTYAMSALKISKALSYGKGITRAYLRISSYYRIKMNSVMCMKYAQLALTECERLNVQDEAGACYRQIALSHDLAGDRVKALHHLRLALALDEKRGDPISTAKDFLGIGYIKEILRQYDSALFYAQQAATILEANHGDAADIIRSYNNAGSAYTFLGHYARSLEYYFKALPLAIGMDNQEMAALLHQNIGEVYYKTGKYKESETHLKKALAIAIAIRHTKRKEQVYHVLRQMEESRKNYKAAYDYLITSWFLRDTIFSNDRVRQVAELETLYETEKKERKIQLLEQEKQIESIWREVLTGGVLFFLMIAFVIYGLQRSRARKTRQLLETQRMLNDKLKEINKINSRFFANVSHEFRTPLTLILAPLDELQKHQSLSKKGSELLSLVKRNAHRLLDLVNQLLDLSKLETGKMELKVQAGNADEFLKVIASSFDAWAHQKQIRFEKNILTNIPTLWFDPDKLEKIVTNLLANAFKFTPPGGTVTLQASVREENGSNNSLSIVVKDTGKGIPLKEQAYVFLPFYQTKQTLEGVHGGSGLGLSLVNELIRLYGGTISLQSIPGVGTAFSVTLPANRKAFSTDQIVESLPQENLYPSRTGPAESHPVTGDSPGTPTQGRSKKDSILVAEDNADLLNFVVSKLRDRFHVFTASNGEEALELAVRVVPGLVLSDLMMPRMNGLELAERIRADARTRHIPFVLLTAKNEQETRLSGFRTGIDDYITKPFSMDELLVRITNLIEQRKQLKHTTIGGGTSSPPPAR